jgi:hypothetical protein
MIRQSVSAALAACVSLVSISTTARAEDAPKTDKSGFNLFNPTPEKDLRSFSPDRPAKSTGAYTVDAGHVQAEMDFATYSRQKTNGVSTVIVSGPNPTVKVGLTNNIDVSMNWAPYQTIRVKDHATGVSDSVSGVSDLFLRSKINVWGNDGGKTAFALIPFVKFGTAPEGLGNKATESGLIASLAVSLPNDYSLSFNTEIDRNKNDGRGGYHNQFVNSAGLNIPVVKDWTLTTELWSSVNTDPSGTIRQYSADLALAWTAQPNLQFDLGANFGLNRDTPALQLYGGVARRF